MGSASLPLLLLNENITCLNTLKSHSLVFVTTVAIKEKIMDEMTTWLIHWSYNLRLNYSNNFSNKSIITVHKHFIHCTASDPETSVSKPAAGHQLKTKHTLHLQSNTMHSCARTLVYSVYTFTRRAEGWNVPLCISASASIQLLHLLTSCCMLLPQPMCLWHLLKTVKNYTIHDMCLLISHYLIAWIFAFLSLADQWNWMPLWNSFR